MSFDRKLWLERVIESDTLTREEKMNVVCVCHHLRDVTEIAEARRILKRLVGQELAAATLGEGDGD